MDTIILFNQNNQSFKANVVRYFKLNNKKYLIISLNECDEQGYIKLYVMRIEPELGAFKTVNIIDETEWSDVKKIIQQIVINNRKNIKFADDLSFEELNGIVITNYKVFKLKNETAEELSKNKTVESIVKNIEHTFAPEVVKDNINAVIDEDEEELVKTRNGYVRPEENPVVIEKEQPKYTIDDFLVKNLYEDVAKEETENNKELTDALKEIDRLSKENDSLSREIYQLRLQIEEIKNIIK